MKLLGLFSAYFIILVLCKIFSMKKPLSLLIFLLTFATVKSQVLDDAFFTGTWKAKKATIIKNGDKPETREYIDGFQKATFIFNADHTFSFENKSDSKIMTQLAKMFNDKNRWVFDKKKMKISIGKKSDGYTVASFLVSLKKDKVIFLVEETDIELVMKKQ